MVNENQTFYSLTPLPQYHTGFCAFQREIPSLIIEESLLEPRPAKVQDTEL